MAMLPGMAGDKQAVEEIEQFDDITVGLMDEELTYHARRR